MLRAIWLTMLNEARLLIKDPTVLFMLLLAPVVIITVAGYSLGALYGGDATAFRLPVVDLDDGPVSDGIVEALRAQRTLTVDLLDDPSVARRLVHQRDRTPLAIVIPAGTSAAVAAGGTPDLLLYVDPVRRIEVNALRLRLDELCRRVTAQARATAQAHIEATAMDLRATLTRVAADLAAAQAQLRTHLAKTKADAERAIRTQLAATLKQAREATESTLRTREREAWTGLQQELSRRQAILLEIQDYMTRLQDSQRAFEAWLADLKRRAGARAADIPPPPAFPAPIPEARLADLTRPVTLPALDPHLPPVPALATVSFRPSPWPELLDPNVLGVLEGLRTAPVPALPGDLGLVEQPAIEGGAATVNAFDQYVPGFGITFLLIGMMMGIALTLFDEREWGTLSRLRVSGAPLAGVLVGKVLARVMVGVAQMAVLFAVGWALFDISLGRHPLALLLPTVGISFAAAALGLVVTAVARAHDSVMPLGVTVSMAMAAIGGCWWPLDFEPAWMRTLARGLPTTWTMQAFNDLMIHNQPPAMALRPLAATLAIGVFFLAAGILLFLRRSD